jgi:hypothetical protein
MVNSGNVKFRGLQLMVPLLSGNSSDGSITCTDTTSGNPWAAAAALASGSSLSCSGSYTLNQDAIEAGDVSPVVTATAANLAAAVTVALPTIAVPSMPQLQVTVDTTGCTLPQNAGACAKLQTKLDHHQQAAVSAYFCCYNAKQYQLQNNTGCCCKHNLWQSQTQTTRHL